MHCKFLYVMFGRVKVEWCLEIRTNDQLSLNCSGTERQERGGGAEGDKARRVGEGGARQGGCVGGWEGGAAEREGVFVCDGQKGGRGWKIPEQSG